jgi:hypothetical protein
VNAVPKRYRRLIALGIVSLLLHMLVIDTIARRARAPAMPEAPPRPIALRLQSAPPPLPSPPVKFRAAPAAPPPKPPATVATAGAGASSAPSGAQGAPSLARPETVADAAPEDTGDEEAVAMPGRYRVAMPPSATLDYALTGPDGAQVPARISWQNDGNAYAVTVDGVTGPLSSKGAIGDTGVGPATSTMRDANGKDVSAEFAPDAIVIGGRRHDNNIGSQDPASLLLQLTGMGLARPGQMRDVIAIYVATVDGPVTMRFKVTEEEELATPLGKFSTSHLVQVVKAGQPRLEVWLAPERGWLPLQLRLTTSGGAASTQTITRIDQADARP